jgi:hypothetical protein
MNDAITEALVDFLCRASAWIGETDAREMAPYIARLVDGEDPEKLRAEWNEAHRMPTVEEMKAWGLA